MRNTLTFLFLIMITYSCMIDYDLDLKTSQPRMVVEGLITNQKGPYLIRLTKSRNRLTFNPYEYSSHGDTSYSYYHNEGIEPIRDAEVYITDKNTSLTDTLVKSPEGEWHYYEAGINFPAWKRFQVSDTSIIDGFYQTTKIIGTPGHTYALTIKWNNQEYHAESYMPEVPPIDSVQFNFTKGAVGKEDYNIPLLFFKEPQNERNYYLFITTGSNRVWPYSVLSDEYLKEVVNGLDVCKGIAPDYWMNAYPYVNGDHLTWDYFIEMHSLTKEAYDYYKALIQQFRTDGGGYSPSPASPPTNLDNGALGFFRTSAVNRVDFKSNP